MENYRFRVHKIRWQSWVNTKTHKFGIETHKGTRDLDAWLVIQVRLKCWRVVAGSHLLLHRHLRRIPFQDKRSRIHQVGRHQSSDWQVVRRQLPKLLTSEHLQSQKGNCGAHCQNAHDRSLSKTSNKWCLINFWEDY